MYQLRRFHGSRFDRLNAIIDSLEGHITSYVNLVGSATLPLPEVCAMQGLPGTASLIRRHQQPLAEIEADRGHRVRQMLLHAGEGDEGWVLLVVRGREIRNNDTSRPSDGSMRFWCL
jgi:hypothetical protein